jgi:hypothetical protein
MSGFTDRQRYEFVARLIVSVVVLIAGLWVICTGAYPDATTKWAFGAVGLVVGYWLR